MRSPRRELPPLLHWQTLQKKPPSVAHLTRRTRTAMVRRVRVADNVALCYLPYETTKILPIIPTNLATFPNRVFRDLIISARSNVQRLAINSYLSEKNSSLQCRAHFKQLAVLLGAATNLEYSCLLIYNQFVVLDSPVFVAS